MKRLGQILRVDSTNQWIAQIYTSLNTDDAPDREDYQFGNFVKVDADGTKLVGIITDAFIVNPDLALPGVRPGPVDQVAALTPDLSDEVRVLVAIFYLGAVGPDGRVDQGHPRIIPSLHEEVFTLADGEIEEFHAKESGLNLEYLQRLMTLNNAVYLMLEIVAKLKDVFPDSSDILEKLRGDLSIQSKLQGFGGRF
ncbi:MAG: hypothetical protein ACTSU5_12805 [Promethearchaeota archaeon]